MMFLKLKWGDWYHHAGLEGGGLWRKCYGVVGGGKCKWEVMMDMCMRWNLGVE